MESGRFRAHYLIYNRKSTDDTDNQKNSIAYQKSENTRFAQREGLPIAPITIDGFCVNGVISEKHSGFKEDNDITITRDGLVQYRIDRPKFQKMSELVSQEHFKGIVCLCWDRLTRNKGDDTVVRKLMRKGLDVRFVYATYDKTSSGALHMDIDGMFAQHHSRVTSEKVSLTIKNARAKGICTYRAPLGYLNLGQMEHKPFDPDRAPVIKEMFELYATGEWSLSDLARRAHDLGVGTVPMRRRRTRDEILAEEDEVVEIPKVSRPLTANHVSKILTNPFYVGKIKGVEGQYVTSTSHEPLVGEVLFGRVQTMLRRRQTSIHYTDKLDLPLRGVVRCGHCGRVYTPYLKKGTHYYGSRCRPNCHNSLRNFNLAFITRETARFMSALYLTDAELAAIDAYVEADSPSIVATSHKRRDELERRRKRIREDLAYIRANKLSLLKTGVYSADSLRDEELALSSTLDSLENAEEPSESAALDVVKDTATLSELLKSLVPYYENAKSPLKEQILRILFSELSVSRNTLKYKLADEFACFEKRFDVVCDPSAWLSELVSRRTQIARAVEDLRGLLAD